MEFINVLGAKACQLLYWSKYGIWQSSSKVHCIFIIKKNLDDFNLFYTQPHDVKIFLFINVK